jgi:hypothetical protein
MISPRRPTHPTGGQRLYAIGDVHGRLDLLTAMMGRVRADIEARPHPRPRVIMLGDYVDRGPESRGVIDALIELKASPLPASFLLGKHDSYIAAYLRDPDWYDRTYHWLHDNMGGSATLASYGVPNASVQSPAATRDASPPPSRGRTWPSSTPAPSISVSAATSSFTPAYGPVYRSPSRPATT